MESIFELFRHVREHPDYVFGTIFVPGDFPDEKMPEDFNSNRANDYLAERGNEYIEMTSGVLSEDDWESVSESDIFDLMSAVREHPDYVFGTIFVPGDFPGAQVPDDFSRKHAEDYLAEQGNEYIALVI